MTTIAAPSAGELINSKPVMVAVGVAVAAIAVYFIGKKVLGGIGDAAGAVGDAVAKGAKAVGTAVNPTSDKNLAYRAANALGGTLAGQSDFSLGSWFYDVFNPRPYDPNNPSTTSVRTQSAAASPIQPRDKVTVYVQ